MKDLFLTVDEISNEEDALKWAINAAIRVRRNKVYKNDEDYEKREKFRDRWKELLLREAEGYRKPTQAITDEQHCAAISRIADELSGEFREHLDGGRLRFGISQKALNLFLKISLEVGQGGDAAPLPSRPRRSRRRGHRRLMDTV